MTELMNGINGPSAAEFVELIERQDCIMDSLQQELEVYKEEIATLRRSEYQRAETDQASGDLIAEAEKKVNTALSAVSALQAHNKNLEDEIHSLREKLNEEKPVVTINKLRSQINELEHELERERNSHHNDTILLNEMRGREEVYKGNTEATLKMKDSAIAKLTSKVEEMSRELVETKFKLEELQADRDHITARTSGELEISATKEYQLNQIVSQLTKEVTSLRAERSSMGNRIAALTQENASLRVKVVKKNLNDPLFGNATEEQMQKLLQDQSHLISALREESKLLTERLGVERHEFKRNMRKMKAENKELTDRIRKLTSE